MLGENALLVRVLTFAESEGQHELVDLCALGYSFILRLKSEGIPLEAGRPPRDDDDTPRLPQRRHSLVQTSNEKLAIHLAKRKNRPGEAS